LQHNNNPPVTPPGRQKAASTVKKVSRSIVDSPIKSATKRTTSPIGWQGVCVYFTACGEALASHQKNYRTFVKEIGAQWTGDLLKCTHVVVHATKQPTRTPTLLYALAKNLPIVTAKWLEESVAARARLLEQDYYCPGIPGGVGQARHEALSFFTGKTVGFADACVPAFDDSKGIGFRHIMAALGSLSTTPRKAKEGGGRPDIYVIPKAHGSSDIDMCESLCLPPGATIVTDEAIKEALWRGVPVVPVVGASLAPSRPTVAHPPPKAASQGIPKYHCLELLRREGDTELQDAAESFWPSTIYVPAKGTVVVGRSENCHVCIPDTVLSRRHVELLYAPEGVYVKDVSSVNGIFINRTRVSEGVVRPKDRLTIGGGGTVAVGVTLQDDIRIKRGATYVL